MKKLRQLPIRTHFNIRTGLMSVGLIIALIARSVSRFDMNAGMWIGLGLMISGIVWHILFIRCPHCGSKLHVRGVPKYCPDCGKELV